MKSDVGNSTNGVLMLDAVPTLPTPETNDPTRSILPNVVVPIPTPPPASAAKVSSLQNLNIEDPLKMDQLE